MDFDSSAPGLSAPPMASFVGPFVGAPFMEAWHRHRGRGVPHLVADSAGLFPLYERDGVFEFVGDDDVTDYHSPLGDPAPETLGEWLTGLAPGTRYLFDSLPGEVVDVVAKALEHAGSAAEPVQHEITAVIGLPTSYGEYLDGLSKKDRHELRRKRRRFEAVAGSPTIQRVTGPGAVDTYVALHRMAGGAKAAFMDAANTQFFAALHHDVGAVIDIVTGTDSTPRAIAFGFEDDDVYYLYNSAFDPDSRDLSPGLVLMELLIRQAIAAGRHRVDLLKGDEPYKFQLGATVRPLFAFQGVVGTAS